jgi:hypothetical protein
MVVQFGRHGLFADIGVSKRKEEGSGKITAATVDTPYFRFYRASGA